MPYTLAQAAQATGRDRSTIRRAIKAGKLSATQDTATGAWLIEPAELHRVYPPAAAPTPAPRGDAQVRPGGAQPVAHPGSAAIRELHARLADKDSAIGILERTVGSLEHALDDLRRRLDASEEERRRLTLMLADQRPRYDTVSQQPAPARRSWWPWRRSP